MSAHRETLRVAPGFDVERSPLTPPPAHEPGHEPLREGREILSAGQTFSKRGRKLDADIVVDRDVPIVVRDGVTLRMDLYRAASSSREHDVPLPTVLVFTPYGKAGGYWQLDEMPARAGIARSRLTGLQAFEAPDPNDWVGHGYAIAVVDVRGSYHSEGDMYWWGQQNAEDGYDVIEWIAAQPWSNGRVGMTGNSQLAMLQWTIASIRPPHLAAIAPWEGLVDHYNDNLVAGGIPFPQFTDDVQSHAHGSGGIENMTSMLADHPFRDEYWASKAADVENIQAPAYVVASITNVLHARGTLDAFRRLGSQQKWLRIHNTMEWSDYYKNVDDLRLFFDRFLKDESNAWDATSPVRYAVIDLGNKDDVDRPAESWPPAGVVLTEFHLDAASATLSTSPVTTAGAASYDSTDVRSFASFTHTFTSDTELVGYGSLELWASADTADDFDVFVRVEKLNRRGRLVTTAIFDLPAMMKKIMVRVVSAGIIKGVGFGFFAGVGGRLRASRRALDAAASTIAEPRPAHLEDLPVPCGVPVKLDIGFWPSSLRWRAGETLRLTVRGQDPLGAWFPEVPAVGTINEGVNRVHTGGVTSSILRLPILPSK